MGAKEAYPVMLHNIRSLKFQALVADGARTAATVDTFPAASTAAAELKKNLPIVS